MRKQIWLRWVLIFVVALFVVSAGASRALRTRAVRGYLITRLEASFGRPVQVGQFDFSLLDGARLEAHSVTVAEDPAFGHEYFLRADSLTAGLRWYALLRGRFVFGTLSLSRPSLNLVRDRRGTWNIERWLPPLPRDDSPVANPGPAAYRSPDPAQLSSIEVDGGRINFKQDDDKSGFALLDVSGSVEQTRPGRWTLDLQAQPMRAGVELQQIGTVRVRGDVGGTSARLQPARLNLSWRGVSLADALRLSSDSDYGVRGDLDVNLNARVEPPKPGSANGADSGGARWSISGTARMTRVHGWRLAEDAGDPGTNLSVDATWRLGHRHVQVTRLLLEMPHSHLQGSGEVDWANGFLPQVHIQSSSLGLADVLAWYRAFQPGVGRNLRVEGTLGVDASLEGWPLELMRGALASAGAILTAPTLPSPLRIGPINASVSRGGLDFAPTTLSFSPAAARGTPAKKNASLHAGVSPGSFVVKGTLMPARHSSFAAPLGWDFSVQGKTARMQDWLLLSRELARPLASGWTAAGSVSVSLRGTRRSGLSVPAWSGTADLVNLTVSPAFLNQPLRFSKARFDFRPSQRTMTLASTEAFGASWRGTVARRYPAGHWTFDLTADHLNTADLDLWLGPRARRGFLALFTDLVTGAAKASKREVILPDIEARGRLRVAQIIVPPLRLQHFEGEMDIAGRTITLPIAAANFCDGKVSGKFVAKLLADPSYSFDGLFEHVNLANLAQEVPSLRDRVSGIASASVAFRAQGIGRQALIRSIHGEGTIEARNAELRGLDLAAILPGIKPSYAPASSQNPVSVNGSFRVGGGKIEITKLALDNSKGRFQADGNIDFSQALNLRIRPEIRPAGAQGTPGGDFSADSFYLQGTLESPRLAPFSPAPKPHARNGPGKP